MIAPLYKRLLGPVFNGLPTAIRDMHDFQSQRVSEGMCEVRRGRNPVARWIADFFRFPDEGAEIPVRVTFDARFGREFWTRSFAGQTLRTEQWLSSACGETVLIERFGPVAVTLQAIADGNDLRFEIRRLTVLGIPMPRILFPRIAARETVQRSLFTFDVRADLPVLGMLIRYHGYLIPTETAEILRKPVTETSNPVMLFDGVCNLCYAGVRFFFARDTAKHIRYCAMQSDKGQAILRDLGLPPTDFKTFAVLDGREVYLRSDAALHLVRHLPTPWRWLDVGRFVPRSIRDWLYDRIAAARFRLFTRRDHCVVPSAEEQARFVT